MRLQPTAGLFPPRRHIHRARTDEPTLRRAPRDEPITSQFSTPNSAFTAASGSRVSLHPSYATLFSGDSTSCIVRSGVPVGAATWSRKMYAPPGFSTRRTSASVASTSSTVHITRVLTTVSTLASGSGRASPNPFTHSSDLTPALFAFSYAYTWDSSFGSTPTTLSPS